MWLNTWKVGHVCGALFKKAVRETPEGQMCPGPPWEYSQGVSSGAGQNCQKAALMFFEQLSYFEGSSSPTSISPPARCWCSYHISHQLMQKLLQKECLPSSDSFFPNARNQPLSLFEQMFTLRCDTRAFSIISKWRSLLGWSQTSSSASSSLN